MKKLLPALLLTGCAVTVDPLNFEEPDYPLICPFPQIEYCTGGDGQNLTCQCTDMEQMRRIHEIIMLQSPNRSA